MLPFVILDFLIVKSKQEKFPAENLSSTFCCFDLMHSWIGPTDFCGFLKLRILFLESPKWYAPIHLYINIYEYYFKNNTTEDKFDSSSGDEDSECCAICLGKLTSKKLPSKPNSGCGHWFCRECLVEWSKQVYQITFNIFCKVDPE